MPYVGFASLAGIGAGVSAIVWLLPSLVFAFAGTAFVHWLRGLLEFWAKQEARVPVIGVGLPLNFVSLLRLQGLHDAAVFWDDRLVLAFAMLWLLPWVFWIVMGAIFAWVLALIYNTLGKVGGGVRVRLRPE
ncbi:MAG: hypothetical protein U0821_21835 [Chloroflexota bacterium]